MTKPNDLEDGSQRIPSRARPRQPWEEEIYQRALERPGFWESLSPEVRAEWEAFDWPSALVGPPPPPPMKRRPRRRGEPPREG
ncbi:MAG: hypothetical protein KY444_05535 [Gemmatimonadetes bacterium]|nr:hypothetical protein [Gemmatimonadota bacterium]